MYLGLVLINRYSCQC